VTRMMGSHIGKGIIAIRWLFATTAALFLVGISFHTQVGAQETPPANPYSGDILIAQRPRSRR